MNIDAFLAALPAIAHELKRWNDREDAQASHLPPEVGQPTPGGVEQPPAGATPTNPVTSKTVPIDGAKAAAKTTTAAKTPAAKPPAEKGDKPLAKDDLSKLAVKIVTAFGRDTLVETLKPFGSSNITGLDAGKYGAVAAKFQELLDAAAEPDPTA